MNTRSRIRSVVAMAAALMMVFASVAMADEFTNDVDVVTSVGRQATITSGASTVVNYRIADTGNGGCDLQNGTTLQVNISTPSGVTANPSFLAFTVDECGAGTQKPVSFSSSTPGTYSVTHTLDFTLRGGSQRSMANEADFSLVVNPAAPVKDNQTITFEQPSTPRSYGDTFSVAPTASSGLPVNVAASGSCSISGNTVSMTSGSGTCTLTASQAGNASFNAAPDVERTVAAEKRPASVTPNAASKTYGDADPDLTGTLSGFLSSDGVTASYSRAAGETVDGGPYAISASLQGDLSNYDVTYNTADFTITKKAASVTPNAASKTYGDGDPGLTGTLSGFLAGDNVTASYSRTAGENAGSYTISATLSPSALLSNYDIDYKTAQFTIDPRPITVTADDKSKVLGADDPALTYSITSGNLIGSDAFTGSLMREAGESVGSYKIQQGTLSAGSNYDLKFVDGNFTIVYDFTGFFRPIDMGGVFNKVKAGQAVPVKFSLGGDQGMDILQGGPKAPTIKCDASAPADAVDETVAATKSSLSYDAASGQYTYVWKTDKGWAGQCRQLQVTLADGKTYMASFNFTK